MDNRITIDPQVYHGQACIKGTRLPVHQILRMLANGPHWLKSKWPLLKFSRARYEDLSR